MQLVFPCPTRRGMSVVRVALVCASLSLAPMALADGGKAKTDAAQRKAQIEEFTDLVVQAIPLGAVFDQLAEQDPQWPLQEKPDAVSKRQLACMRKELSSDGYRKLKREDVAVYVDAQAATVPQDMRILSDGAALLMGKFMLAGAEQERTGVPVDQEALASSASPDQLIAFMSFMTAPDYAPLRRLAGIGNAFDAGRSEQQNEAAGEAAGADLATTVILKAMGRCDVPTSVLFE